MRFDFEGGLLWRLVFYLGFCCGLVEGIGYYIDLCIRYSVIDRRTTKSPRIGDVVPDLLHCLHIHHCDSFVTRVAQELISDTTLFVSLDSLLKQCPPAQEHH